MGKAQPNLFAFPNVDAFAPVLRAYIIQSQAAGIARHGAFKLAVSSGSLPKTLAAALLAPPGPNDQVELARWEIFFTHEHAVPLDHDDSNYAFLKKELLDKIPEDQKPSVHPIGTTHLEGLRELADQYQQTLVASFASRDSVRLPIFDLLLPSCGPDGYALLRETSSWVAPIDDSPKPPQHRIALTLPVVAHAVRVAFVATGGDFDTNGGLPCSLVNEATGVRCSWFVDEPAVEGVSFPRRVFL
ncbi:hypothetical protein B0T10DRAFT_541385 [Thelonectria olida]|uniref:Glucosamine/galactosamine-6-phosphate isomerase domain-containing protein n=1 Tax=Thelonectria olida TaxID=1576542 RepID=A0A9P8VS06_9HYPO|nr:hypothetical protein B0T10DRAFT_541385 [Thelonectria olida]